MIPVQGQIDRELLTELEQNANAKSTFKKGRSLMKQKRYAFALEVWKVLIKTDVNNANYNYQAGVCCGRKRPFVEKELADATPL